MAMSKLRVNSFSISIDGYGAGPDQSLEHRLGGGVATVRQYLQAGLIDEMHIAISPILLGSGENLFTDIDMLALDYECSEHVATASAMHLMLTKR